MSGSMFRRSVVAFYLCVCVCVFEAAPHYRTAAEIWMPKQNTFSITHKTLHHNTYITSTTTEATMTTSSKMNNNNNNGSKEVSSIGLLINKLPRRKKTYKQAASIAKTKHQKHTSKTTRERERQTNKNRFIIKRHQNICVQGNFVYGITPIHKSEFFFFLLNLRHIVLHASNTQNG